MGVAIIGWGKMGQRRASVIDNVVAVAETGVVQPAIPFGANLYREYQAAILHPNVDTVVVATPHDMLGEVAAYAAAAGRHVFIEKPGAATAAELRAIVPKREGQRIAVGYSLRYHPGVLALAADIHEGYFGDIDQVRMVYANGKTTGWRLAQGGHRLDLRTHLIDLWVNVFRFGPESIDASIATGYHEAGNLFRIEVMGARAKGTVEGLGGHYGQERYTRTFPLGAYSTQGYADAPEQLLAKEWDTFALDCEYPLMSQLSPTLSQAAVVLAALEEEWSS